MPTTDGKTMYVMEFTRDGDGDPVGSDTLTDLVDHVFDGTYVANTRGGPGDPGGLAAKTLAMAQYLADLADEAQVVETARVVAEMTGEAVRGPLTLGQLADLAARCGAVSPAGRDTLLNACAVPHMFPVHMGPWDERAPLLYVRTAYLTRDGDWLDVPTGNVIELDPSDERVFLLSLQRLGVIRLLGLEPGQAAEVV